MTKFQIVEEGFTFATIEARTAKSALRKATKQFPRSTDSYNDSGTIEWYARSEDGSRLLASASVKFPGHGDSGCTFRDE